MTSSDPGAVTRFFQRAGAAGSIHHRNVVEIVGEGLPPEALRRLHFQKLGGIGEPPQPKSLESSTTPSTPLDRTDFMLDAAGPPPPLPSTGEPPPREHTGAHEIFARAEAESRSAPPRPHPPDRHIPLERDDPANRIVLGPSQLGPPVVAPPEGGVDHERQPPSRWPAVRASIMLALVVLALVVLGVLLRWIF